MYLHLGENTVIRSVEIVGIIDIETTTVSKITKDFLYGVETAGRIVNVSYDMPKSAVLCEYNKEQTVYISPISPQTLLKRAGNTQ